MKIIPATTSFNLMNTAGFAPFVLGYRSAVQLGDVDWLEKNVAESPSLNADNRRWLANLDVMGGDQLSTIYALSQKNHRLFGFLLREGASPEMVLPFAITERDSLAIKMLCDAGIDANKTYQSVPLLNISAALLDAESCEHLLNATADVNGYRNDDKQCTALYDCMGVYEQQVRKAFDAGMSEAEISSIPQQAALRTIGVLLERGADEHQKGPGGFSAYDCAVMFSGVDPRPLELIHEWRSGAAATAEMNNLMARMRKPGAGLT